MVADNQLQRVLTRCEFEGGLSLSAAEVTMMLVGGNRLTGRWQLIGVYQQVMVAGCGTFDAGRGNAHAAQSELHGDR